MTGRFYGVGVGPGDSELMTIKAVKVIQENDVIALPGPYPEDTVAYKIAVQAVPELSQKELLAMDMPMTKDKDALKEKHKAGAEYVEKYLKDGKNVVFLCIGDPSIYSTYSYIEKILLDKGYETVMISGIPSFCAASSKVNSSLTRWNEPLKIIPVIHNEIECKDEVNYVYMKAGKRLKELKRVLAKSKKEIFCIENCGMVNEHIYYGLEEMPDEAGYYTKVLRGIKVSGKSSARE